MATLEILLENTTGSALWAYVTGKSSKGIFALEEDGSTVYHPEEPDKPLQPPKKNIAISVEKPWKIVKVPYCDGARIWFSKEKPLKFLLNPGPVWVEPSPINKVEIDNYLTEWGFCEFTYNKDQVYINISYVDFVSLPISLQMATDSQSLLVRGMPPNGLEEVCQALEKVGKPWNELVQKSGDKYLRALSPNSISALQPDLFKDYYARYINEIWGKYSSQTLVVNTQTWGDVNGSIKENNLTFDGGISFTRPSTGDVFSCATGPFDPTGVDETKRLNIGARICAAFNRSTLHMNPNQPESERIDNYYKHDITNHYARICHEVTYDNDGYAFPYDDVRSTSSGEKDQSGFLQHENPGTLLVRVGGLKSV
jgi:hypothetical protein